MIENNVEPTPDAPEKIQSAIVKPSIKPATPDLILFNEDLPIELLTDLLFEDIGGIEILTIARSDLINGQNFSYGLIANSAELAKAYSPDNFFKVPGGTSDIFENFPIKFAVHVPDIGTAPSRFYVGEENSFGCTGFPVLNKTNNQVLACLETFRQAEAFAIAQQNLSIVYVEEKTGNVVVDVLGVKKSDRVEIEILSEAEVESDTIY
jgi:hypothetical protein